MVTSAAGPAVIGTDGKSVSWEQRRTLPPTNFLKSAVGGKLPLQQLAPEVVWANKHFAHVQAVVAKDSKGAMQFVDLAEQVKAMRQSTRVFGGDSDAWYEREMERLRAHLLKLAAAAAAGAGAAGGAGAGAGAGAAAEAKESKVEAAAGSASAGAAGEAKGDADGKAESKGDSKGDSNCKGESKGDIKSDAKAVPAAFQKFETHVEVLNRDCVEVRSSSCFCRGSWTHFVLVRLLWR